MREKKFSFNLSNFHRKAFFNEKIRVENFTNRNFANFATKTLYLAFKIILNENQSGWSRMFHSAQLHFKFFSFYFLD